MTTLFPTAIFCHVKPSYIYIKRATTQSLHHFTTTGNATGKSRHTTTNTVTTTLTTSNTMSSSSSSSTREFKHRLLTCLNKLSDRDTHSVAASELQTIAKTLTPDQISPFLSSISATDSSDKSPVRKQCVSLISTLSESHGDVLSSHVSKLISAVVRRLRDPDSAVRSACIAAVGSISAYVTKPPFTSVAKPLVDALVTEQDLNSQIGAALCLAAAVDGAPDPEPVYLRRMVVRIEKLLKVDSFKAKAALLTVLGSVIGVGGVVSSAVIVKSLVSVLVGFVVKSEDWSARKAAAEALEKLAVVERDLLLEFKSECLKTFEAKKFDKVKVVRETMNQMIEAWKAIPDEPEEEGLTPAESHSSSKAVKVASNEIQPRTPQITNKRTALNSVSTTTATSRISLENSNKKTGPAMFRKLDRKKHAAATTAVHPASPLSVDDNKFARPETKRALFNEIVDEEVHESEYQSARLSATIVESNITEDIHKSRKDSEELSLIRNHLVQIETRQANLVDLLQKFTRSSETGMRSLETRVHGLELTLDEISFDLARSTGRLSHPESTQTLCCKLPGAGFLTSKLWTKTEIQHSNTRISSSPFAARSNMSGKNMNLESCNPEKRGFRRQEGGSGLIKNPLAVVHYEISEI
ncbi:putative MT-associated protein TORTIFOLIA1/SPIRAL2 [Helianthus annuus]|uniref:MT-associated protein TORTIFOLIA1/SPIRAL2 n=1 Tax=Helianthus annuus TaxID=4232 RepID=A0A251RX14_HELAN|nr:TORTIFOLIA1-like protein 3 [Helianthus annuus]KAF5758530.1 putative MT-associated protein TORTIFOLIA1/SPIRAL2 [Helianthus annuus]